MISIMPILTLVIITTLCLCVSITKQRLLQASTGLLQHIHTHNVNVRVWASEWASECMFMLNIWISYSFSFEQWDFHKLIDCRNFPEICLQNILQHKTDNMLKRSSINFDDSISHLSFSLSDGGRFINCVAVLWYGLNSIWFDCQDNIPFPLYT